MQTPSIKRAPNLHAFSWGSPLRSGPELSIALLRSARVCALLRPAPWGKGARPTHGGTSSRERASECTFNSAGLCTGAGHQCGAACLHAISFAMSTPSPALSVWPNSEGLRCCPQNTVNGGITPHISNAIRQAKHSHVVWKAGLPAVAPKRFNVGASQTSRAHATDAPFSALTAPTPRGLRRRPYLGALRFCGDWHRG